VRPHGRPGRSRVALEHGLVDATVILARPLEPAVFAPYSTIGPPRTLASFLIQAPVGKDLAEYSYDPVKVFASDAATAGYHL